MVWLLIAVLIYAIIFVAGRAHSRYLDRLEARRKVVMTIRLFDVSPDVIKETEFTADVTSEVIEPFNSFAVRNENETCVRPPEADTDNRNINNETCPVSREAELRDGYGLREMATAAAADVTMRIPI